VWAKISDEFYDHPKVLEAGDAAVGVYVRLLTYSARHGLDGWTPSGAAAYIASGSPGALEALERARLVRIDADGVTIPDYLEYNPSAGEVERKREQRREAGRRGGLARAAGKRAPSGRSGAPRPFRPDAYLDPREDA
jgi:hypothetical protein